MTEKTCMDCENRMLCERYLEWINDPTQLRIPRVNNCENFKEEKQT